MSLFVTLLIAVSLSMDAFSLSLVYGTLGMSNRDKYILSIITGIFHFFMPLFGMLFGSMIFSFIKIDTNIIVAVILSFIGIEMVMPSFKKERDIKLLKGYEFLLFALAVSIDSFSVGITLSGSNNILLGPIMFSLSSFIFTLFGLIFGGKIKSVFGEVSTIIGGVILIIIGVCYII